MKTRVISFLAIISIFSDISMSAMLFSAATSNRVLLGTSVQGDVSTGVTVSAWINPTSLSGVMPVVCEQYTDIQLTGFCLFPYFDNKLYFDVADGFSSDGRAIATGITTGSWQHIVGTWDGSTVRAYVNGTVGGTTASFAGPLGYSGNDLNIGASNGVYVFHFDGSIDDVRIYNRALSQFEISQLYASRSRLNITDGLVGYWRLDDGANDTTASGATVRDYSGRGYTGTATDSPTWAASTYIKYP